MKPYLKTVIKRYLLLFFFLSFSSLIASQEPFSKAQSLHLFFYQSTILSIFSLLFATLSTLQTYQKNGCTVALSMSGIDSFTLMKPTFYFALFLSFCTFLSNEWFLTKGDIAVKKSFYLSPFKQQHHLFDTKEGTVFYKGDVQHFTFIDHEKNILYAKYGEKKEGGFVLYYVDHFKNTDQGYEKNGSNKEAFFAISIPAFKEPAPIKNSETLLSLLHYFFFPPKDWEFYFSHLLISIGYKSLIPFLHLFSVALPSLLAFNTRLRKNYSLTFCLTLFLSLFAFFSIECSAILGFGSLFSPVPFFSLTLVTLTFPTLLFALKKV